MEESAFPLKLDSLIALALFRFRQLAVGRANLKQTTIVSKSQRQVKRGALALFKN